MKRFFMALALYALQTSAFAKDMHNFYFQKAPGPVTVNQGESASPSVPNANNVASTPTTTTTQQETEPSVVNKQWNFGFFFWKPTNARSTGTDYSFKKPTIVDSNYIGFILERKLPAGFSVFGEFSKATKAKIACITCDSPGYGIHYIYYFPDPPEEIPRYSYGIGTAYELASNVHKRHSLGFSVSAIAGVITLPQYTTHLSPAGTELFKYYDFENELEIYFGPKIRMLVADTVNIDIAYRFFPGLGRSDNKHRGAVSAAISYHF